MFCARDVEPNVQESNQENQQPSQQQSETPQSREPTSADVEIADWNAEVEREEAKRKR